MARMLPLQLLATAMLVCVLGALLLDHAAGMSLMHPTLRVFHWLFGPVCAYVLVRLLWFWAGRPKRGIGGAPAASTESGVVCVGAPRQLALCEQLDDYPREPLVCWAGPVLIRPTKFARMLMGVIGLACLAGGAMVNYLLTGSVLGGSIAVFSLAGMLVAPLAAACLCPTYVRVTPGSLEILHYSPRPERPSAHYRYDLTTCDVIVNLRDWTIHVRSGQDTLVVPIMFVRGRAQLAQRVLLAAVSTWRPPPLPDTTLLG
ncbi:MAG: hypothetical protein PVJ57_06165 [Phycisphaerae bacterium]